MFLSFYVYNSMFNQILFKFNSIVWLISFDWMLCLLFMQSFIFIMFQPWIHRMIWLRLISTVICISNGYSGWFDPNWIFVVIHLTVVFIESFNMHDYEYWTMYKIQLFVGCVYKMQEYVVWFGEVDSENLSV